MKNKPFFSIITPTYNREKFLSIAIESVLSQSFSDFELVVVDDGSTDNTEKLISKYKDKRIRYIHKKHEGVTKTRNYGINKAKGKFICFLDSDDRFRTEKLKITYDYIKKYPKYKIFHTDELWYRKGQILPQKAYHKKPSGNVFEMAAKLCCISISTAAIKRDIFDEIGVFDESLPACEDYDFWIRVTAKYPVLLIPQILTIKEGGHLGQQSKKYEAMDKFRIHALSKILKQGNLSSDNYKVAYDELKNKCNIYIKGAKKRGKTAEIKRCQKLLEDLNVSYKTNPFSHA